MDPETGEILAMVSYPWFDPNTFADARGTTYRNRAVTDAYEPGSTNKVITAAAAIQIQRLIPGFAAGTRGSTAGRSIGAPGAMVGSLCSAMS